MRSQGLTIVVRDHSISVRDCECFTIEFDGRSDVEASIEGTAANLQTLIKDVELVARALTAEEISFWIEIADSVQNPLHYYHNRLPQLPA